MHNEALFSQLRLHLANNWLLNLDHGWSDSDIIRSRSELWLVMDGGAYLNIGDKKYRVIKGDMCLLPDIFPREHGCDRAPNFKVWVIQFYSKITSSSLFEHIACSDLVVHTDDSDFKRLQEIFSRAAVRSLQGISFERMFELDRDLNILLCEFLSRTKVQVLQKSGWLEDTLQYISIAYSEPLPLKLLAERVAMHPKHFARRFRETMGITPGKYIAGVRFERARQMLFDNMPLQQISDGIGMGSIQQFFRFFKSQSGMSPREYQKKNQEGEKL